MVYSILFPVLTADVLEMSLGKVQLNLIEEIMINNVRFTFVLDFQGDKITLVMK